MCVKLKKLTPEVVRDKIVVIRVDFNVPVKSGSIVDNTRIMAALPTFQFLLENKVKRIHVLTHLGRPNGQVVDDLSTNILASELERLLGETVEFQKDFTVGSERIQMHENVRFWAGNKDNSPEFLKKLSHLGGEVFVMDAFAVAHREEASITGLPSFLPAYPGLLVTKEVDALSPFMIEETMSGLCIVMGGAKLKTKIPVLTHFAQFAEHMFLGGALANTFRMAQGYEIGKSFYEEEYIDTAREIFDIAKEHNTHIHLPIDVVCAEDEESSQVEVFDVEKVSQSMSIFDIGPKAIRQFCEGLRNARSILWNGPVGMIEKPAFEEGTRAILTCIAEQKSAKTVLGGGDTLKALHAFGVSESRFSHVSTGGGAMLEFLEGKDLPGITPLLA